MTTLISRFEPKEEDFARVGGKLTAFTLGKGGPNYQPLSFAFRAVSSEGVVMAELIGSTLWGVAEVNLLHTDPRYRKQGIGKKLLSAAEDFVVEARGAKAIHLWTPSFQGEGFYERAGYKEAVRFPLNTEGHFGDKRQFKIVYYKDLDLDMTKAAQAGDYAAIAAFAQRFPDRALERLDDAAAADPKLGEGLTPYFTKAKCFVLDVEDIRLRLELKALPKKIMRGFGESLKPAILG